MSQTFNKYSCLCFVLNIGNTAENKTVPLPPKSSQSQALGFRSSANHTNMKLQRKLESAVRAPDRKLNLDLGRGVEVMKEEGVRAYH